MKTGKRNSTGANGGNGEENLCSLRFLLFKSGSGGVVELGFDKSISDGVNIYAKRDGDADFVFLACRANLSRRSRTKAEVRRRRALNTAFAAQKSDEGWSPYIYNRPLLAVGKPELREYKAVYVQNDAEIG